MAFPNSLPPVNEHSAFADMRGHHVALRVPDFETAKRWFIEKLDFRVIYEWPFTSQHLAYLAPPNDDRFWVEILGNGTPPPAEKPAYGDLGESLNYAGFHHFCMTVNDIDVTVAELKRRGVTIAAGPFTLDVINRKLAFLADPWGNLIELAQVLS